MGISRARFLCLDICSWNYPYQMVHIHNSGAQICLCKRRTTQKSCLHKSSHSKKSSRIRPQSGLNLRQTTAARTRGHVLSPCTLYCRKHARGVDRRGATTGWGVIGIQHSNCKDAAAESSLVSSSCPDAWFADGQKDLYWSRDQ